MSDITALCLIGDTASCINLLLATPTCTQRFSYGTGGGERSRDNRR